MAPLPSAGNFNHAANVNCELFSRSVQLLKEKEVFPSKVSPDSSPRLTAINLPESFPMPPPISALIDSPDVSLSGK